MSRTVQRGEIAPGLPYGPLAGPDTVAVPATAAVTVRAGTVADCVDRYRGSVWGVDAQKALDSVHFVSAGTVGFARGLNDAPKIAALLLAGQLFGTRGALLAIAAGMLLGGTLSARRVARTLSYKITEMNSGQGFVANLVTSVLVTGASWFGVPVSTTHVSCGALFGIGAANGKGHWGTVATIVGAWLVTLPMAALLGAGTVLLLEAIGV